MISVIIPFFNREEFLAEAIQSVIKQSYQNWEIILVNDGSSDGSLQIAQDFAEKFPHKIFLFSHENNQNRGASFSRNLGIKHAKGEFITFLDSDDIFLENVFELELATFEKNASADVVCGTLQYWFSWEKDADKRNHDFIVNLGLKGDILYEPPTLLVHNLRAGGRKPGINCVMLKTDFVRKIGAFESDFLYVSEDQVFWAKVSLNGKIFVLDDCISKYRQHPDSSCAVLIDSGKETADWNQFLDWLEKYLKEQKVENQELWQALKFCRKENDYKSKYKYFKDLYRRIFPLHTRYWIRDQIVNWRTRGKN